MVKDFHRFRWTLSCRQRFAQSRPTAPQPQELLHLNMVSGKLVFGGVSANYCKTPHIDCMQANRVV